MHTIRQLFFYHGVEVLMHCTLCRVPQQPGPCNALRFRENVDITKIPPVIAIIAQMEKTGRTKLAKLKK